MFQTVYTIKRINADSIRAYDYQYTPAGLDVYRLAPNGTPMMQPELLPYEEYKGIARDDIRTAERFPVTLGTLDTQARARAEMIQDDAPAIQEQPAAEVIQVKPVKTAKNPKGHTPTNKGGLSDTIANLNFQF